MRLNSTAVAIVSDNIPDVPPGVADALRVRVVRALAGLV
jgi:hypothetical protein